MVNRYFFYFLCLIIAMIFLPVAGGAQELSEVPRSKSWIWNRIAPFFTPPDSLRGVLGNYRSPLRFYDDKIVKTKDDWNLRRSEIAKKWHDLMGEWPALIKEQDLQLIDSIRRDGIIQFRVRFRWTPDEETEGYLLRPDMSSGEKLPAVITVFYEPESAVGAGRAYRDFAYQLAKRGFITLSIGTSHASEAKTYALYYPSIDSATVQPLSMLAYAAANAWNALAKFSGVDSTRIGIMGHSFGGKWAMFASCLYEKFTCAVWSDPGIVFESDRPSVNYWEPWYLGYHPKPWRTRGLITANNPAYGLYPRLIAEGYDLHELHALMAPRPFLVSGGEEDPPRRWIPLNHSINVNAKLGVRNRVAMTNRSTHSPDENSNEIAYLFLEYFLK